jgi:hypothetical protein
MNPPQYSLDRRLGGPQLVWTRRQEGKSLASARDLTTVVQSVVRHYTDRNALTQLYFIVIKTTVLINSIMHSSFLWKCIVSADRQEKFGSDVNTNKALNMGCDLMRSTRNVL